MWTPLWHPAAAHREGASPLAALRQEEAVPPTAVNERTKQIARGEEEAALMAPPLMDLLEGQQCQKLPLLGWFQNPP